MFGYVRVREDALSAEATAAYQAVYCGLCRTMGRHYGGLTRCLLNYDFTLLAMLLAPADAAGGGKCLRCPLHPFRGKPACPDSPWLTVAGAESVILAYWKLKDAESDEGFLARRRAGLLRLMLGRAYRRAREDCPGFDREVRARLEELRILELERCPSMDRTADCFARLLQAAAPKCGDTSQDRALEELLYHLGRWIYLIDAVDDLDEDRAVGRYNPVAARFPTWGEEERTYLRRSMDHSLALAGAAFQLLERNPWSAVVENILYGGLPNVEELVFSGMWRTRQNRKKHGRVPL